MGRCILLGFTIDIEWSAKKQYGGSADDVEGEGDGNRSRVLHGNVEGLTTATRANSVGIAEGKFRFELVIYVVHLSANHGQQSLNFDQKGAKEN